MEDLEHLFLNLLLEQFPYNEPSNMFDQYGYESCSLELFDNVDIEIALEALLSELRTAPCGFKISRELGVGLPEVVDLRKVQAAVDGYIMFLDGEWVVCSDVEEDEDEEDEEENDSIDASKEDNEK